MNQLLQESIATAINDFSVDVFSSLMTSNQTEQDSNQFVSSISLGVALMMLTLGSVNNTLRQLLTSMKFETLDNNQESRRLTIHESYSNLLAMIKQNPSISVDNFGLFDKKRIVGSSSFNIYKLKIEKYYQADVKAVNFLEGDSIMNMVNERVAKSTRGLIPAMMKEPPKVDTVGLLFNVIYFEGKWIHRFNQKNTEEGVFYSSNGEAKMVQMMKQTQYFWTTVINTCGQEARVHKLDYNNDTSMVIFLPSQRNGLKSIIGSQSQLKEAMTSVLTAINGRLVRKKVRFSFPRFSLQKRMVMNAVLQSLGVRDVFQEGIADLRGISEKGRLFVSSIDQEAVIKVDEEGTKAAAVTTIHIMSRSLLKKENIIDVTVDHPFLFLIRDDKTRTILFVGVVNSIPA
jgi:serine protease inhibitor